MMPVDILDALKQPGIQPDVVGMLGQDGLHLLCQGIHFVVGLSTQQVEEHGRHPRQQVVVTLVFLSVDDGVVKSRTFRIIDGLLYLFIVAADTLHESLLIVFYADAVEGHRVMRCVVRLEERVYPLNLLLTHIFVFVIVIVIVPVPVLMQISRGCGTPWQEPASTVA